MAFSRDFKRYLSFPIRTHNPIDVVVETKPWSSTKERDEDPDHLIMW